MAVTIEELRQEGRKEGFPLFKAGQTVRVHYEVKEGDKKRIQIFEGLIISVNGKKELGHTIVVRRVHNGFAVEQGFAVHAPHIQKIELVKIGKVRQSRIFYMRERQGKSARLKEKFYSDAEVLELIEANK
jgi:large subunit ribosomal protein L19